MAVALLCVVLLFPFYWMVVTAVLPTSQVLAREPTLVPALADMSLRAFAIAFERKPLGTWLANSLLVTLGATTISPRHRGARRLQPVALPHPRAGSARGSRCC